MINTYDNFVDRIGSTIKIRSKNFVNTDCNIEELTKMVYSDIMTKINLGYIKDGYLMDGSQTFEIRSDDRDPDDLTFTTTEIYGTVMDIVDEDDYDISKFLQQVDNYTFKWVTENLVSDFDGKYIYFVRPVHYDIVTLPVNFYHDIFPAMIEGIMYHIEVSIPSQVDGQLSNLTYQRYYQERQVLLNRFPQVQYVEKNIPKRNNEWLVT